MQLQLSLHKRLCSGTLLEVIRKVDSISPVQVLVGVPSNTSHGSLRIGSSEAWWWCHHWAVSKTAFQMLISHWCFRRWCTKPTCVHKICMLTTSSWYMNPKFAIILPQGRLYLKEKMERGTGPSGTEKHPAEAWSQEIGKFGKAVLATSTITLDHNVWWKILECLNFYIKHVEMVLLKKVCL